MREIKEDELKQILLEIFIEIDHICREHNIKYYVIGGTLLGAVRHNGFIPWDDDIDLGMYEEDYEKFRQAIKTASPRLRFDCMDNSADYPYAYGKVCRTDTVIREKYLKGYDGAGAFVDVFRIDGRGKKAQADAIHTKLRRLQASWLSAFSLKSENGKNLKKIYWKIRYRWRNRRTARQWAEKINAVSKQTTLTGDAGEYCACVHDIPIPNDVFKDIKLLNFEGLLVPCPIGYKKYLEIKYGDYLTLPPEGERVRVHSFEAYWKE